MQLTMKRKSALFALCAAMLVSVPAFAQVTTTTQAATQWDDQLALDVTPIPAGLGALFVPTLSNPSRESRVVVFYEGQQIAAGKTGERILVPPGTYEVALALGDNYEAARVQARAVDGITVVIEPFFGGIELTAVNKLGEPIDVPFAIEQNGKQLVRGSTPSTKTEPAKTYLLPPGPKTWEFSDGTKQAFYVPKGEKLSYRAVFDGDRFVELQHGSQPLQEKVKWWRARWTIGADVSFNYATDQLSNFSGMYGQLGAFSNTEFGVDYKNNLLTFTLSIDESWITVDSKYGAGVPIRSIRDSAKLEFLYAYRLFRIFGPFVRASAETSFFGSSYYADADVAVVDEQGASVGSLKKGTSFELMPPLFPLLLEEAAGVNLTIWDGDVFDFILLGGVGARQQFYKSGFFVTSENNNVVTVKDLKDEMLYGAFAEARMGLRLGSTFRFNVFGSMFVPYEQILKGQSFAPLYSVSGLAEFAISSWASLVYRGEWRQATNQTPTSMYHGVSLRLQTNLF